MSNQIKVEFFHDVICSFCFPMSYRMRQIQKEFPNVSIVHRSYALAKKAKDFDTMFQSRSNAKDEILKHWEHANQNDDLHRFNIQGMKDQDFLFPSSMKPLKACKAAFYVGGDAMYWDVFDALQEALFVKSLNVDEDNVLFDCIQALPISFDLWKQYFESSTIEEAVDADLYLAHTYGLQGVPALVIDEKHILTGAQSMDTIRNFIQRYQSLEATQGEVCSINGCE